MYQELLSAIYDGRLEPGQRLNDIALADELGISRTPVREAIQKLRAIGVVESEPNRFTRVAIVSPEQVRQHMIVWVALMHALIDEVAQTVPKSVAQADGDPASPVPPQPRGAHRDGPRRRDARRARQEVA